MITIIITSPNDDGRIIWSLSSGAKSSFNAPPFGGAFFMQSPKTPPYRHHRRHGQTANEASQVGVISHSADANHLRNRSETDHHPRPETANQRRWKQQTGQA